MAANSVRSATCYGTSEKRAEALRRLSVHIAGRSLPGRPPGMGICMEESAREGWDKGAQSQKHWLVPREEPPIPMKVRTSVDQTPRNCTTIPRADIEHGNKEKEARRFKAFITAYLSYSFSAKGLLRIDQRGRLSCSIVLYMVLSVSVYAFKFCCCSNLWD